MSTKSLHFTIVCFILLLSACAPAAIATSSGEQPRPVEATDAASRDTQPVSVENVQVVVGVGSPLPVEIVVGGTWPSLCSQIAGVQSSMKDFQIDISILASMTDSCPPDNVGLSFRFAFPLNVVEMQEGTYTITVNGVSTSLDLPADLSKGTGAIFGWVWQDQCVSGQDGQPATGSPPAGCVDEISPVGPYHANGIREPNEQPLEGVTVRLIKGSCASDSLEQIAETTTIAGDVSYSFTDLPAGSYCVLIDPQEDVNRPVLDAGIWTYPTVTAKPILQDVFLGPAEGKYNVDFGWDYQLK
jgi:hypothetical protein